MSSSSTRLLLFLHETSWSGAPVQLLHLAGWFKTQGWAVAAAVPKLAAPESGPISKELAQLGIDIFPVLDLSVMPNKRELRSLCARFDVVIANTLVMWAAVQAAHEEGVPVIWYIHESVVARQLIAKIGEIQPTLAMADLLVTPTFYTKKIYAPFTDREIEVVPYGIPEVADQTNLKPNNRVTFLLLGSYEPRKGQDIYLQAIALLPIALMNRAIFRSAGRKLEAKFYESLVECAAALPNVELIDALEHDEACAAIASADVLVCASRDETMPIAILEAMSLGKAIVSTNVGGIEEWLRDGDNCLLVPAGDTAALAQAMTRCLQETGLVVSLGTEARRIFRENFSVDRLGRRFSALIERVRRMKNR